MRQLRRARTWLRGEWRRIRGAREREARSTRFEDEARFHVEMLTERHVRSGLDRREARRRALLEFGALDGVAEAARDEYRSRPLEELWRDVRVAVRNLVRIPAFTVAAVLTLALGIGATTVVFSIVDHVVLRPLPYRDADRLVVIREVIEEIRGEIPSLAARAAHYLAWREQCEVCDDVASLLPVSAVWRGDGEPLRLPAVRVSANLFPLLGVEPLYGRFFGAEEDDPERSAVVVVSHGFWQRHLGADPAVVGSTLLLGNTERLIVGVLPPRFRLPKGDELGPRVGMHADPDIFIPLALTRAEIDGGGNWNYTTIARLAPGVTPAQAELHFTGLQRSLAAGFPEPLGLSALVIPLRDMVVGGTERGLLLLLGAVAAVLLLVCVNLANLLLARHASRAREAAVRAALGAGRLRLVREALTESLVLAVVAGVVGLLLSWWGLQLLLQLAPADMPRLHEVRLDHRIAGVAVLLALLTGIGFGALPARRSAGADAADVLKAGGRARGDGRAAVRGRSILIGTQVGMTAVLLAAAGLFLGSFVRVLGIDKGFTPDRVLALDVTIPSREFASMEELLGMYERMLHELAITPGIASAAVASKLPLEGITWTDAIREEGAAGETANQPVANFHMVSGDYFRTLDIRLRSGRAFGEAERGRNVVVLSERVARALWPGESPAAIPGRRVQMGGHFAAEVIGVAADVAHAGLEAERAPIAYLPVWNSLGFPNAAAVVVRSASAPVTAIAPARAALRRAAPGVVISGERTMHQLVAAASATRRFQLSLLALFALTALVTACIGIYGVIAHSLARRRGEIGVRMALGARRGTIHRLVLGEGMRAAGAGMAAGLLAVATFGRVIESQLYEGRAADPAVLGAVVVLLGSVAALACYIPARRATSLDPAGVLRQE